LDLPYPPWTRAAGVPGVRRRRRTLKAVKAVKMYPLLRAPAL
jgi:hypothetical protein